MTTHVTSFAELLKFLDDNKVPHKTDPAAQLIELPSKAAPLPGNLYIRWEKTLPFLQIIHVMIENVPEARVGAMSTALIRLNNKLELGGFGFDHEHHRLYCRLTMPVLPPDGINPVTLDQLGHAVVRNAKDFTEAFQAVIDGASGDEIVAVYQAIVAKRAAAPAS